MRKVIVVLIILLNFFLINCSKIKLNVDTKVVQINKYFSEANNYIVKKLKKDSRIFALYFSDIKYVKLKHSNEFLNKFSNYNIQNWDNLIEYVDQLDKTEKFDMRVLKNKYGKYVNKYKEFEKHFFPISEKEGHKYDISYKKMGTIIYPIVLESINSNYYIFGYNCKNVASVIDSNNNFKGFPNLGTGYKWITYIILVEKNGDSFNVKEVGIVE